MRLQSKNMNPPPNPPNPTRRKKKTSKETPQLMFDAKHSIPVTAMSVADKNFHEATVPAVLGV